MKTLKLKRRLILLALITGLLFTLTPAVTTIAGEPGAGCGDIEDGRWAGHAINGTVVATYDSPNAYLTVTIEGPPGCETQFETSVIWPPVDYCLDPETGDCSIECEDLGPGSRRSVCRGGFYDLTPGEIRLVCFQHFGEIPCIENVDAWVQIVGAGKLNYSDETHTSFTANIVMMEVVPVVPKK